MTQITKLNGVVKIPQLLYPAHICCLCHDAFFMAWGSINKPISSDCSLTCVGGVCGVCVPVAPCQSPCRCRRPPLNHRRCPRSADPA